VRLDILFYDYVADMLERRAPHREAHLELIRSEKDAGKIVIAGALGDPPHGGAIVFAEGVSPSEIERFVAADPYCEAGLVTAWRVEPWNVV
jgi:uncharacterized protein YciI